MTNITLVISVMSKNELSDDEIAHVSNALMHYYIKNNHKIYKFYYADNFVYNVDIDIYEVGVSKSTLNIELNNLIKIFEELLKINANIDFIVADKDTSHEVSIYEKDWHNVASFGLFVTTRNIPNLMPFYQSEFCKAFMNLETVKFGIYD